ncbi:MAG: hypothetical protein IJ565_01060 [Bacilli bacterium]|nr:hypothetical protein [Bacilli bacterium]
MRKSAKERKNVRVDEEIKVDSFFKILGGLLAVLLVFTLITMFITRDKKEKDPAVEIQYDKIIVGSILNRSEEDYYVLVEAPNDDNSTSYESYITTYNNKDNHKRFYIVDLSDDFNSNYISTESNLSVDKITDIRFSETTLIHVVNGKISSTRVGDNITTYLENLSA